VSVTQNSIFPSMEGAVFNIGPSLTLKSPYTKL